MNKYFMNKPCKNTVLPIFPFEKSRKIKKTLQKDVFKMNRSILKEENNY